MLPNLTIVRHLCFHKHWRTNLNAYGNMYFRESIFLLKENQAIQFIIETMIQKNLKRSERMEVLITSYVKVCVANKYISYYILLEMQR